VNIPDSIEYVLVYSTVPDKVVIGYFKVKEVQQKTPEELWHDFGDYGEIEEKLFFDYYANNEQAKCILIDETKKFMKPIKLHEISENMQAPQSFRYIDDEVWHKLQLS
jgi:predicted transcriptional regulator